MKKRKQSCDREGSVTSLVLGVGIVLGLLANQLAAGIGLGAIIGMMLESYRNRNCK